MNPLTTRTVPNTVSFKCLPKTYGIVKCGDKQHHRNYKRELKNGKGLSGFDLMVMDSNKTVERIAGNVINKAFQK